MAFVATIEPLSDLAANQRALEIFSQRLTSTIDTILALPETELGVGWQKEYLGLRRKEEWVEVITVATEHQAKLLLGAERPPTIQQLLQLPRVSEQHRGVSGVYLGVLETEDDGHHDWTYTGSGTAFGGRGIAFRTDQHANPKYRRKDRERRAAKNMRPKAFYALIDDDVVRALFFVVLLQLPLTDTTPDAAFLWRITIVLAEQIFASWLATFSPSARESRGKAPLLALRLWEYEDYDYKGTNSMCPLKELVRRPGGVDSVPVTAKEYRAFRTAKEKAAREKRSEAQKKANAGWQKDYDQMIRQPVRKMRRQGKTEAEIEEWKKNAEHPVPVAKRLLPDV